MARVQDLGRSGRVDPLLVVFWLGCGGPAEPSSSRETLTVMHTTAHFQILAGNAPDATLRSVGAALEVFRPRILADLGVAATRTTSVRIWQDEASFAAALESFLENGIRRSVTSPDPTRPDSRGGPVMGLSASAFEATLAEFVRVRYLS